MRDQLEDRLQRVCMLPEVILYYIYVLLLDVVFMGLDYLIISHNFF